MVITIKNINLPVVTTLQYLRYYCFTMNNSENPKEAEEMSVVHGEKYSNCRSGFYFSNIGFTAG